MFLHFGQRYLPVALIVPTLPAAAAAAASLVCCTTTSPLVGAGREGALPFAVRASVRAACGGTEGTVVVESVSGGGKSTEHPKQRLGILSVLTGTTAFARSLGQLVIDGPRRIPALTLRH